MATPHREYDVLIDPQGMLHLPISGRLTRCGLDDSLHPGTHCPDWAGIFCATCFRGEDHLLPKIVATGTPGNRHLNVYRRT